MSKQGAAAIAGLAVGNGSAQVQDSSARPERKRLSGRVALVTGAARGIGPATAEALAREGADVMLLDIAGSKNIPSIRGYSLATGADLDAATAAVRALGVKALPIVADVRDRQQMESVVNQAAGELGGLDIDGMGSTATYETA